MPQFAAPRARAPAELFSAARDVRAHSAGSGRTLAGILAGPLTYRYPVPESSEASTESPSPRAEAPAPRGTKPGFRARPPLEARRLLAAAAGIARGDPLRILAAALTVSVATVLVETAAEHLADPHSPWEAGVAAFITEAVGLLGTVALSGFLCRLTRPDGQDRVSLRHVIATLPWGRLIMADLIVTAAVLAGLAALVIPGFIISNLLAVVGPLIEIEDQPVRAALRRSRRLVWPYFWPVALLITAPIIILTQLESAGPEPTGVPQILEALAIRGLADGLLEAAFGLVLTQLCYRLISLDAAATRARRAAGAAGS
jgi:hypothetical protein